ncbi:aspartate aminotransferase family protein [Chelativorans sp. Marseille-P2723]|uniref:aspartate aminotransferase family protein n=1 Tax=Chelativorans sp. Marseille-P2723 TaxID=2709133 RepID=UPI00156F8872|nr:aspartate aminotransferase family protein [Chelativorans sp. Marseille-P2723]
MGERAARPEQSAIRTSVFHRYPAVTMPSAARGEGPYILDTNGKRYIDGSSGAAVSSLGHGHPRLTAAIKAQLDELAFAHTGFFTSQVAEELADLLTEAAPGMDKVYFVSGGSEAVETAIKVARQYFVDKGEPSRRRIISRRQSYHGNTLGALAAGGNIWRREKFGPLLAEVRHISPCYPYREQRYDETEAAYGRRIADELEAAILSLGPQTVMCFIAETVGGATLGAVPPVEGYFTRIREICDRYGVLLILDEVMCGMGRTGTLFAYEQEGIVPDIVTLAKGLGSGYQPLGAMMTTRAVFETIVEGSGFFQHGHTYTGHITACAAGLEVQRIIRNEDLLSNVRLRGAQLADALQELFGNHPHIGDIRGRGLMLAMEFVADRSNKTPFDPNRKLATRLKAAALERGLICYPMSGLVDGVSGDHVMLAPPFIIDESHVAEIVDKLDAAITAVLAGN